MSQTYRASVEIDANQPARPGSAIGFIFKIRDETGAVVWHVSPLVVSLIDPLGNTVPSMTNLSMAQNGQTNESIAFYQSLTTDPSGNWAVYCSGTVSTPQGNFSYRAFTKFRLDALLP